MGVVVGVVAGVGVGVGIGVEIEMRFTIDRFLTNLVVFGGLMIAYNNT